MAFQLLIAMLMLRLTGQSVALGITAALLMSGGNIAGSLTAEQILANLEAADAARDKQLQSYKVTRTYRLHSDQRDKSATATAEFEYRDRGGKSYRILEEQGSEGLFRRALHKVMQAEVKASNSAEVVTISAQNYTAKLLGREVKHGYDCFVLELTPTRKSKYLLEGKAWIDAAEFGLVHIEGRPTESLSFWVGKPYIEQTFEKVDSYWLLANNRSVVDAKLVGRLEFTIKSSGYSITESTTTAAKSPNPAKIGITLH